MGRPIKEKWFGTDAGSLQLLCNTGTEAIRTIRSQVGNSKFETSTGIVKLVNKTATTLLGEASLVHNGKTVRKLTQYKVYYFDGTVGVWNDKTNVIGTFVPALV